MATVIKKVETHFVQIPLTGAICCNGHHNPFASGEYEMMDPVLPGNFDVQMVKGHVIIRCDCKRKLKCSAFTNTCDCGREYNWSGDLLADRTQWEEDRSKNNPYY